MYDVRPVLVYRHARRQAGAAMKEATEQGCRPCLWLAAVAGLAGEAWLGLCTSSCKRMRILLSSLDVCLSPSFHH